MAQDTPPTTPTIKRSPIRNREGIVDSDLLLKWGGAGLALLLLTARGLGPLFGLTPDRLPGLETIGVSIALGAGHSAAYLVKRKQIPRSTL